MTIEQFENFVKAGGLEAPQIMRLKLSHVLAEGMAMPVAGDVEIVMHMPDGRVHRLRGFLQQGEKVVLAVGKFE